MNLKSKKWKEVQNDFQLDEDKHHRLWKAFDSTGAKQVYVPKELFEALVHDIRLFLPSYNVEAVVPNPPVRKDFQNYTCDRDKLFKLLTEHDAFHGDELIFHRPWTPKELEPLMTVKSEKPLLLEEVKVEVKEEVKEDAGAFTSFLE